ncbi:STAS domain-containing protein [Nocardia sp. ET3-3]|uniref:STAS domain-containing protein n=2 Tax=Nocardia terrae TaxID=2675851 RepID=A0A7K1V5J8_9NOCA|nr:STAS domain-containing protein [Nocardia terrae]
MKALVPIMITSRSARDQLSAAAISSNQPPRCAFTGELDICNCDSFRAQLSDSLPIGGALVVDLHAVTFFSLSSLQVLLEVQRLAEVRQCDLLVVGSRCVDRVLDVAEVAAEFTLLHYIPN